jgi:hypothetical protein
MSKCVEKFLSRLANNRSVIMLPSWSQSYKLLPVGGHRGEVGLLVLIHDQLRLADELRLGQGKQTLNLIL